jgi:hypothetical protein
MLLCALSHVIYSTVTPEIYRNILHNFSHFSDSKSITNIKYGNKCNVNCSKNTSWRRIHYLRSNFVNFLKGNVNI